MAQLAMPNCREAGGFGRSHSLFAYDDADAARARWRKVASKLPKLAGFLHEAETHVLAYMTFPPQHQLHSPNPIERLNAGDCLVLTGSQGFPW